MNREIIKFLLYFDVFSFPLTKEELYSYAGINRHDSREFSEAEETISSLAEQGIIQHVSGFYCLAKRTEIVQRRIDGSVRAKKRYKTATRYSRIIDLFPFVRGVFLSGSISKGYMSEMDDIDYFIISSPGRLWLSRTLLTIFKKVFLFNSYRNFCLNFFLSEDQLEIKERHLFFATEIVFLIPMYNGEIYDEFLRRNSWVKNYFPAFRQQNESIRNGNPWPKQLLEWIMNKTFANRLEKYLFRISVQFIQKKFRHYDDTSFKKHFRLTENEIRYFPGDSFPGIRGSYETRLQEFQNMTGISLAEET